MLHPLHLRRSHERRSPTVVLDAGGFTLTRFPSAADGPDYATLFAVERNVLLTLLRGLDTQEWCLPTACPGWSVLDLAAHLLGDDLGLLARQRDGHSGIRPPAGADNPEAFARWLDGAQDAWVRGVRRLSPRLVVDLLTWTGSQVVELFHGQDPEVADAFVSWASDRPVPRWLDHARELSEHWIHRQQLLLALGRPTDLGEPSAGVVLDALRWAYPHNLGDLQRRVGSTVTILVEGPVTRAWHLRSDGSTWDFVAEPGDSVVAGLVLATEQFWRLLTNNLPTSQQAQLDARGDQDIIEALRRTRAIIGIPN